MDEKTETIKEEIESVTEGDGAFGNFGGVAGGLAGVGRAEVEPIENELDSVVQAKAMKFFMNLGLEEKTSAVLVKNIAIPDLETVMYEVPKIDTAAEVETEI
jgi:hypothetical protein